MAQSLNDQFGRYRKGMTAFAGAASLAVSQGLIGGVAAKWIGLTIGFLTAMGVYAVPNEAVPVVTTETVPATPEPSLAPA